MKVIADSSLLIALATVDVLSLLSWIFPEVIIPDAVLVDDERAWEVARQKGIAYLRSTELVLEAHRRQLLDAETAEVKLVELGKKRWISEEVVEVALRHLKARQKEAKSE